MPAPFSSSQSTVTHAVLVQHTARMHAWEIKKCNGQNYHFRVPNKQFPILNYLGFNKGVNAQYLVNRVKKGDACVVEAKSSVRATPHQQRTCICFQRKAAKAKQRPPPLVTSQVNIQRNNTNKMKLAIATLLAGSAAAFNVKEVRISSLLIGSFPRGRVVNDWRTHGFGAGRRAICDVGISLGNSASLI